MPIIPEAFWSALRANVPPSPQDQHVCQSTTGLQRLFTGVLGDAQFPFVFILPPEKFRGSL